MSFSTPILLLIFNRPELTEKVFVEIKKQRPQYLYIAADGPRINKENEVEKCRATRQVVLDNIDWTCQVKTLFRDENIGCGKAVSEAITWFFDNVEQGIILEDDCLPSSSFFSFCEELLNKYHDNSQVMHIGGSNFQDKNVAGENSYYFSNYIHIWGWATWRRAWQKYEFNLQGNDPQLAYMLKYKFSNGIERHFWQHSFETMANHLIDTWDTQWVHCFFKHNGIGITTAQNLISNIGCGPDATHTIHFNPIISELPVTEIEIITHPKKITINKRADRTSYRKLYQFDNTKFNRIKFRIGKMLPFIKSAYLSLKAVNKKL
ncbi:nucleotide-diphospho-sugar transferase [Mucilaginibacter sp.]|uniref:nucleotide-diphospho-sugar transferase n=1 Tax=Mucilaginibacter sp. TaxID=1882438 RepID=UPI00326601E4